MKEAGRRRVAVTGGAGFIGFHLTRALITEGAEVTVLDDLSTGRRDNLPDGIEFVKGDVRNPAVLKRVFVGADVVFHLAAIASVARCEKEVHRSHAINLGGTVAVIEAVRDAAPTAPIIYASSAAVYGIPEQLPLPETAATVPLGFYGLDKLAGENALRKATSAFCLNAVALRLFNVYGARQDPHSPYSGVISIFADRLARGLPTAIHGDGEQTRDFIRAEDVARHFAAAADMASTAPRGTFEVFNVCTGTATTINTLYGTIAAAHGIASTPVYGPPKAGDIRHSCGDRTRARARLAVGEPMVFGEGLPAYMAAAVRESLQRVGSCDASVRNRMAVG